MALKLRIALVTVSIVLAILAFTAWKHVARDVVPRPLESATSNALEDVPVSGDLAPTENPVTSERKPAVAEKLQVAANPSVLATATLRVLVRAKEDQQPLANVHVLLRPKGIDLFTSMTVGGQRGKMNTIVKCSSDGRAEFEAQVGVALTLMASSDDHSGAYRELDVAALGAGEERQVVIELATRDDFVFFGSVIDRDTRAPLVADVHVEVPSGRGTPLTFHTDAYGRFSVPLATWSPAYVVVLAHGYAEVDVVPEKVHDSTDHALVIEASRAATLRVRLTDAKGDAIEGASVKLEAERYSLMVPQDASLFSSLGAGNVTLRKLTDTNGIAELTRLPPNVELTAVAMRGGEVLFREFPPITMKPGEVRELAWRIGGGCELKGRIVDQDSKPVAQRTMWLSRTMAKRSSYFSEYDGDGARTATTDDDGRFSFEDVAPGDWLVGPANDQRPSYPFLSKPDVHLEQLVAPFAQIVEIVVGEAVRDVELRVDRGLYIRGQVLDPSGVPVAEAFVHAWQPATKVVTSTYVHNGDVAIGPLMRGTYFVTANAGRPTFCPSDSVECATGTNDLVLRLKVGGSIRGIVIDGDTNQPAVAVVTWSRPTKPALGRGSTQSKPDGTFTCDALEPDLYELTVSDSRGRFGIAHAVAVAVSEETKGVRLVLDAGAIARVRYEGDEPYGELTISANGAIVGGDGLPKGMTHDFSVPRGAVKLTVFLDGADRDFERTFDFKVGETKVLEFPRDWR